MRAHVSAEHTSPAEQSEPDSSPASSLPPGLLLSFWKNPQPHYLQPPASSCVSFMRYFEVTCRVARILLFPPTPFGWQAGKRTFCPFGVPYAPRSAAACMCYPIESCVCSAHLCHLCIMSPPVSLQHKMFVKQQADYPPSGNGKNDMLCGF